MIALYAIQSEKECDEDPSRIESNADCDKTQRRLCAPRTKYLKESTSVENSPGCYDVAYAPLFEERCDHRNTDKNTDMLGHI